MNHKYYAVGAYIFAGGQTVGVKNYFNVDLHLEASPYGVNIMQANMPEVRVIMPPWPKVKAEYIYSNPPCAPFSMASAGRKTHWSEDPRLSCFDDCADLIHNYPNILAIESVLATWRKAESYIRNKCKMANDLGYATTVILHNGAYLGLPQVRNRMFLVFHNLKLAWHKTHLQAPIACDVALNYPEIDYENDQMLRITDHVKYLLMHRRPNDNTLLQIHDRLGFTSGMGSQRPVFTSSMCRPGKPAPTLLHCMHSHPIEPRFLTINEMSRLCGFPDSWNWHLTKSGVQAKASLISRGVTPTVASWMSKLAYDSIKWNQEAEPTMHIVNALKGQIIHINED